MTWGATGVCSDSGERRSGMTAQLAEEATAVLGDPPVSIERLPHAGRNTATLEVGAYERTRHARW